ncbi:MGMT family protein [Streptomyces griseus]|uniref:MGMT family protein n=1 Tax=Streptomyces stephensoniae TaxID=3375367 RepID=A0ABU2W9X5_9ACTN|nr:MGMT family protein [Streptomyces griseus]MDT0494632.1 MGMT family protein [Streptomyces griseus]
MSQDETGGGGPGAAPAGDGGPPTGTRDGMRDGQRDGMRDEVPGDFQDRLPEYAERVLDVADLIPPGRVMTYGDVAEWLGDGGPRQVGRVMALYGSAVPWWRVVRADGTLLPGHELQALDHYRAEGTPLREASRQADGHLPRLDMRRARWDGGGGGDGSGGDDDGQGGGQGEETHT